MIPKIIHYIWLGSKPLPELVERCIESWKKFCPDYEIKRWDETNLDLDEYLYVRQSYDAKKYAFASDVIRYKVLYEHGGIYLDVDVELIKNLNEFLTNKLFMGFEDAQTIAPGLILGSEPKNEHIINLLKEYETEKFINDDGTFNYKSICSRATEYLLKAGLKLGYNKIQTFNGVTIYPKEYFCPLSPNRKKMKKTENTFAIHWYMASWVPNKNIFQKIKEFFKSLVIKVIGRKNVIRLKNKFKKDKK